MCESKLSTTIGDIPGRSFWTTRQPEASDLQEANSKRSFNSSLEGTQPDVWCEKTPRQSERVQNSRLTLSHWALWTLSHNSSPAVISSSSFPCHPFFSTLKISFLPKGEAWNARPINSTRQESQMFPEPPPPRRGHLLDQLRKQQILWTRATNQWQVLAWDKLLDLTLFGEVWVWLYIVVWVKYFSP